MAERKGQKIKIVCTLDILKKYSDEDHPITATEICEKLSAMGVTAERKSVYDDITNLIDYGYDIIRASSPKRGFFLASREFEVPEIYLLTDAVRTAKFITPKKTRELISKLDSMLSENQAGLREKRIYIDSINKCNNEEIYYSIDVLSDAIAKNKQVEFDYITRTINADRTVGFVTKHRTISPYALTWQDDHYYLIGNYDKYDNIVHFRLDRMRKVTLTDIPRRYFGEVSDYSEYFDIADYTSKLFSMHSGKLETVELCCNREIAEQVFDRFSTNIFIKNFNDQSFDFSVKAAVSEALVTWIMNYGDKVKVKSPESLKQMIKSRAKAVLDLY